MDISFAGRNYLILGAGITGNSIGRTLVKYGASVSFLDENSEVQSEFPLLKPEDVDINNYDTVVDSPGWNPKNVILVAAIEAGLKIENEIDIAWDISRQKSPLQKWLALTGTNGKTTTVEMTAAILQNAGFNAVACGNVGDTVIDAVDREEPFDYLILELSSFQLHWLKKAEFVSAAILNIAEDHLDWHGSFDNYCKDKFSILDRAAIGVLNAQDQEICKRAQAWPGRKVFFSLQTPTAGELGVVEDLLVDRAFVVDSSEAAMIAAITDIQPTLPHSISNALAAAGLARSVGVPHQMIQSALRNFRPGRHRIELIREANGAMWIDDSKATNPHAASASIKSHLSVIWIAGGLAKGADMSDLIRTCAKRIKFAILIGADRDLIESAFLKFSPQTPRVMIDADADYTRGGLSNSLMERIVTTAASYVEAGDTVLMAPACASMDQCVSYADRGDRFAEAVKKLVHHEG